MFVRVAKNQRLINVKCIAQIWVSNEIHVEGGDTKAIQWKLCMIGDADEADYINLDEKDYETVLDAIERTEGLL